MSTSGRVSALSKERLEKKIVQPTSMLIDEPSSMTVGHLDNTAAEEFEKERVTEQVEHDREAIYAIDESDALVDFCRENLGENSTDAAASASSDQLEPASLDGSSKSSWKDLDDLHQMHEQMITAKDELRDLKQHLLTASLSDDDKKAQLRSALIELDHSRANYLKKRTNIVFDLYQSAEKIYRENPSLDAEKKRDAMRLMLAQEQMKIDRQILAIRSNDRFVQREILYKIECYRREIKDDANKDRLDRLKKNLNDQVGRLEAMLISFEKDHFAAYQRMIIDDAFIGITADNKLELETNALFDQNRFAQIYGIAHRIGKEGKYKDGDDAIERLAKEANITQAEASTIMQIATGDYRDVVQSQLLITLEIRKKIQNADVLRESYSLERRKPVNLTGFVTPLPSWFQEAEIFADELYKNRMIETPERKHLMRKKMFQFFELNFDKRVKLNQSQQALCNLLVNQAISGVKPKSADRITGTTSSGFLYYGDFENGRLFPSGIAFFASGKSSQEAYIESKMPTRLRLMYEGGINNLEIGDYAQPVKQFSDNYGGKCVEVHFNSSVDATTDLDEVRKGRWEDKMTYPVMRAAQRIRENLAADPGCAIHILAHSQGCIHIYNALIHLEPDEIKKLCITFVAPGKAMPKSMCENSLNLVRSRDLTNIPNYWDLFFKSNVKWVEGHPSTKWHPLDHSISSLSYQPGIQNDCEKYKEKFEIEAEQKQRQDARKLFDLTNGKVGIRV